MTFLDFFAGIGGFRRGMELAGHKCVGFCEFDKFAVASYTSMHLITDEQREYLATLDLKKRQKEILKEEYRNGEWFANDVRTVSAGDIPAADCWCFGFPCFVGDTLVLTYDGYKRIDEIEVGEIVLTHKGRWKKVTSVMSRDNAELWQIKGFGILPTLTTAEHPYYLTKDGGDYEWIKAKDITDGYFSTIILPEEKHNDNHSESWWWLAGRYLADGWTVKRKDRKHGGRVVIACNDTKLNTLLMHVEDAGYHYSVAKEKTCNKVHIVKNALFEEMQMFGQYAYGKKIPGCVFELPKAKAEAFYQGYMSGDGRCDKEEATSVSPALILGMAMIAVKTGRNHPGIYKSERHGKCIIEGRECNQRDTYTFRITDRSIKSYDSNGIWCRKINRATNTKVRGRVYNISVEEDESYIANGAIVHNCQDISVAGKQVGFYGNRSSLFFRVMYLLGQQEEEKKPTYLFIENVKNLLSVNGGWDFARLLVEMDKGGYDAEWQVLNSKYFGVPQNRERCFIVGHLRGRSSAEVFPIERTNGADYIHGVGHRKGYRRNTQIFEPDGITETLDTGAGGGRGHHTIEVVAYTRDSKVQDRTRVLSGGGYQSMSQEYGLQRPCKDSDRVITVGNTNPSGKGMNGNCYSADGVNPTLTTNKGEGNKVAIPVLTPDRANKRQNGRRFKEDGEEAFTLTGQDRHGVAVEVEPMQMSGYELSESEDEAHSLNCSDQRKVFGAHQTRTMVGYNTTLKSGGWYDEHGTCFECKGLQRTERKQSDDDCCNDVFAIDKGIRPEEREVANCIEAREDRGLSKRKQEGTLICVRI